MSETKVFRVNKDTASLTVFKRATVDVRKPNQEPLMSAVFEIEADDLSYKYVVEIEPGDARGLASVLSVDWQDV